MEFAGTAAPMKRPSHIAMHVDGVADSLANADVSERRRRAVGFRELVEVEKGGV